VSAKSGVALAVTLAVPHAGITGLESGYKQSATLTLVATNANGEHKTALTIPRLKPKT
jgi:hypothetical protein